jgi:hypothetical protein
MSVLSGENKTNIVLVDEESWEPWPTAMLCVGYGKVCSS